MRRRRGAPHVARRSGSRCSLAERSSTPSTRGRATSIDPRVRPGQRRGRARWRRPCRPRPSVTSASCSASSSASSSASPAFAWLATRLGGRTLPAGVTGASSSASRRSPASASPCRSSSPSSPSPTRPRRRRQDRHPRRLGPRRRHRCTGAGHPPDDAEHPADDADGDRVGPLIETHRLTKRFGRPPRPRRCRPKRRGEARCSATSVRTAPARRRPSDSSSTPSGPPPDERWCSAAIRRPRHPGTDRLPPRRAPHRPRRHRHDVLIDSPRRCEADPTRPVPPLEPGSRLDPTRPVGELSTGNRRKIGIVQAFAHNPELLILDEPTSGLDPLLQHQFHQPSPRRSPTARPCSWHPTSYPRSNSSPTASPSCAVAAPARRHHHPRRTPRPSPPTPPTPRRRHTALATQAFQDVPGVVSATVTGDVIDLVVEGSVDAALKAAATLTVRRLVTLDSDLEDSFLAYYHDDQPR